ncbi:transmembrane protein 272-like [Carcharodon carcharias]|uniref:transmembrane protein 272-like n=1 Tax=Carcharodon carcharias TaxID=13397 RepID=UPI001B7E50F3|nr:transmembrane protein 272-like [Carcharodon carcharias]XP_041034635.1 transmembrane protein 272-like [Carcharodon carcharias]XP_041034636.1 transmembrane protein 272-like [Carcharodon carcharias]XP_041034637.1 transmembrane protein 272-like [Carcharodon carcharias]XP_041034638.1 transmembrane protein 272-like [Carcharodon carcharias]
MDLESSLYTPLLRTIEEPPNSPVASVSMKIMTSLLAIASITIGTVYLDSCTKQYLIPIYLIVSGSFTLFFVMISLVSCTPNDESNNPVFNKIGQAWKSVISLFSFIWFIMGNIWIYSIYEPDYIDKASPNYCDKTLYLFAFWATTVTYILLGIVLFLGFCGLLCACALGGTFWIGQRG